MRVLDVPSLGLRFEIVVDPTIPANSYEIIAGDQRRRMRWPDEKTEIARWADDGGVLCE